MLNIGLIGLFMASPVQVQVVVQSQLTRSLLAGTVMVVAGTVTGPVHTQVFGGGVLNPVVLSSFKENAFVNCVNLRSCILTLGDGPKERSEEGVRSFTWIIEEHRHGPMNVDMETLEVQNV
jgi:hypothetical protein